VTSTGLVVGLGNPDRGDDAAGILTVRRLRGRRRVEEVTDCSTLLHLWEDEPDVTVIDATVSDAEPGTVRRFDGLSDNLPSGPHRSTHSLGLAEVIELARALDRLPARLTIYGIEASSFRHGEPLSPGVELAVETLATSLGAGSD
jgi:hydrogenase maturation protease